MSPNRRIAAALVAATLAVTPATAQDSGEQSVRLAAGWIDATLAAVAASAEAVGQELAAALPPGGETDVETWRDRAIQQGTTTGYRTWATVAAEPAFQAPVAGLYSYGGELTPERASDLAALTDLVPLLRSAYRGFDFSWVYVTTADDLMLIYPYVPISEAVHNDPPTAQVYYTAADTDARAVGWTAPYLDLVGAGMMVTASYPVFAGDRQVGVASRDITLDELSRTILGALAAAGSARAVIVDRQGLGIAASDTALAEELKAVNAAAGAAVLHYRTEAGLAETDTEDAKTSAEAWLNDAVERVIATPPGAGVSSFLLDGRTVQAAEIPETGWFLILAHAAP